MTPINTSNIWLNKERKVLSSMYEYDDEYLQFLLAADPLSEVLVSFQFDLWNSKFLTKSFCPPQDYIKSLVTYFWFRCRFKKHGH